MMNTVDQTPLLVNADMLNTLSPAMQLLKGDVHSHRTGEFNAIPLPSPQMHPHMPHAPASYCHNYYTNATTGTTTCATAKISSVI